MTQEDVWAATDVVVGTSLLENHYVDGSGCYIFFYGKKNWEYTKKNNQLN